MSASGGPSDAGSTVNESVDTIQRIFGLPRHRYVLVFGSIAGATSLLTMWYLYSQDDVFTWYFALLLAVLVVSARSVYKADRTARKRDESETRRINAQADAAESEADRKEHESEWMKHQSRIAEAQADWLESGWWQNQPATLNQRTQSVEDSSDEESADDEEASDDPNIQSSKQRDTDDKNVELE